MLFKFYTHHLIQAPFQLIHILSMDIRTTDRVLINMRELGFNSYRVISLLMQNRAHRVAKSMSCQQAKRSSCVRTTVSRIILVAVLVITLPV